MSGRIESLLLRVRDNFAFAGKGVALLEPSVMRELSVDDNDIIEIMGRRTAIAVVISIHYSPIISGAIAAIEELEQEAAGAKGVISSKERGIWLDMVTRENAKIKVGDLVKVRRKFAWNGICLANQVILEPVMEDVKVDAAKLAEWFHCVPVMPSDLVFWYERELFTHQFKGSLYRVKRLSPAEDQPLMICRLTDILIDRN